LQEARGEGSVQQALVQGDVGGPVEVLPPADVLEAGEQGPAFQPGVVPRRHLVGEEHLKKGSVVQLFAPG